MEDEISRILVFLTEARSFEDAAAGVLRAVLLEAEEAASSSRYGRRARILRGVVHVRPGDGYRRLMVLDAGAVRQPPGGVETAETGTETDLFASATAWRSVAEHRCPVSIDVGMGTFQIHGAGAARAGSTAVDAEVAFSGQESRQRFLGRHASHVYVHPLCAPGGSVEGMISVEAECMGAVGQELFWSSCQGQIHLIASLAAPYLINLPLRPTSAVHGDDFLPVVGSAMADLVRILRVFARQEETLLISGPTGSGKSRLARWCHEQSRRRAEPFERLDLTTVPDELQMAELFGWRKGAFTGAVRDNPGSIARAQGGTLFIDEIDKLSLKAQAGLLRVLEERVYRMLGEDSGDQRADVRFMVGTNADLRGAVRAGKFREDLYYRINVLPIRVLPLDERGDEIPGWASYMLGRRHRESDPNGTARLAPEAQAVLAAHSWPGNLRQLDNIIRRAYTLAMVEHSGTPRDMELAATHIERALAYEVAPDRAAVVEALRRGAAAFVHEAQRRGTPLDLDHADAFRGFVLGTAVQQYGLEEAFRLVGRDGVVKNRNQHKFLRRELEKVAALCRAIGTEENPFTAVPVGDAAEEPS